MMFWYSLLTKGLGTNISMGCFVPGVAEMAWDVLFGGGKSLWDVFCGLANLCGMFTPV